MDALTSDEITPFHTFDPMHGSSADELAEMLESVRGGGDDKLIDLPTTHPEIAEVLELQGVSLTKGRSEIGWDDATILFMALRATEGDGSPAEPLERGVSMERLGRFPSSDGNAIAYLRNHLIPEKEGDVGSQLLKQLDAGFRKETRDHDDLSVGFGGMILHGWLTASDVSTLRTYLQQSAWKVARNEPFDGGIRDVVRHLLIILKTAEKRGFGVLMRAHS